MAQHEQHFVVPLGRQITRDSAEWARGDSSGDMRLDLLRLYRPRRGCRHSSGPVPATGLPAYPPDRWLLIEEEGVVRVLGLLNAGDRHGLEVGSGG